MTTGGSRHSAVYGALLHLYPRAFTREYRGEMLLAFRDDLRERGAARAWRRALPDLVLSVPVQHVEATVSRESSSRAAQAGLAAAVLVLLTVLVIGRYVVIAIPLTAVLLGTVLVYWRSRLPYREAISDASAVWWRVLVAGAGLLAAIGIIATYGPDVDWFPWHLAALLFVSAWAAMFVGVLLGLLQLSRRVRHRPAGMY